MKSKILLLSIGIGIICLITPTMINAQEADFKLIKYETGIRQDVNTALHFLDNKNAVTRFRDVQLNERIKSYSDVSENDKIILDLFPDAEYIAQIQKVEEIMEGNLTITANLLSFDYAFMVISTTEGRTLANIFIPEKDINYQILSDPITLQHYLLEINPKLLPKPIEYPSLIPGEFSPEELEEQEQIKKEIDYTMAGPNDPATVDVMIVYTPAARTWGNSHGGIFNIIATSIVLGNTALSNSSTILTLRLVHNAEVQYIENVDPGIDLDRLTNTNDGYMDNVHTLRNTYGADMVQLFTTMSGGIAWLLDSTGGDPTHAFSCVGVSSVNAYSAIHEMGHNMGCGHHKQQNFQAGPGLYSYSAGWRWKGSDNQWYSSIMSYTAASYFPGNPVSSTRVGYFSNPSISYMGAATGHASDGDNARTIRNTKHVIAAYRSTATINCIACPGYNFEITPGVSWVTHSSSIVAYGCKIYRVSVQKGSTYTFKTGCGNGATASFDTRLYVLNEDCTQVAFNDDGCESHRSQVTWMATYTGYAYVGVNGYSSASGSYTMAYQRTNELTWTGNTSTNWNTASNWNGDVVPDNTFDVIIPTGATRQPNINTANASCKSLTINSGATLTVGGYTLNVSNDINISGTLAMNHSSGKIFAYSDVSWKSGSTANFTANSLFWVYGNWEFLSGSNANLANGEVAFTGTTDKYISNYSQTSSFNNVSSYKSSGAQIGVSYFSNQVLTINGFIYIASNAAFNIYSQYDVILKKELNSNGSFKCNYGRVVLNGSNQYLKMNTGDYFNNLTFNQSGTVTINDAKTNILEVKKDVVIKSGVFNMQDRIMRVGGDWTNEKGSTAFNEGTGRVIFNGTGHQYVKSSENFNILEANMGNALRVDNVAHTVTCNQYDWTSGGIDVLAGTFTALDLVDNGLYGEFWVNPGGTINLHQDNSQYIDLNGKFNFHNGGTINVYGGSLRSYWSWDGDAEIYMNGGVLDFKDQGIYIFNSSYYSLTHNITGGTIRTSQGLLCDRTDFTPAGGTFEFYGSTDATINMYSGSQLRNVKINKSSKEGDENFTGEPVYDQRSGEMISEGGKANTITLLRNLVATGDLTIEAGNFNLGWYTCNVAGTTKVFGNLTMNNADNDLTTYNMYWDDGSSANVTAGTFHAGNWDFREGTTAKLGTGNTAYVTLAMTFPTSNDAEFGNLVRGPLSKNITDEDNTKTFYPVRVMGNMLIKSGADLSYHIIGSPLIVVGNLTIEDGGYIEFSGDDLEVGGTLNLAGTLEVSNNRTATIQGAFTFPATGRLKLNKGTFTNNYNSGTYNYLYGKLTMNNNSLLEFPGTSIMIGNTFENEVSGGTLRFGKSLAAPNTNNFQLDHGTVEFISAYPNHSVSVYNGNYLNDVVINKTGVSFLLDKNLVIKNDLEINSGSLNTLSNQVTVSGNVAINNGGHLSMGAGGGLAMAGSKSVTVNNGGLIEFNGESGAQSKITRNSSGYYALNIESGGKIGAEHTIFEYMNTDGVNIKPGAIVDIGKSFNNCIFRNGQSGGRLLTINNNQTFSVNYAMFPNNSWGGNFNVYKSENSGVVTFGGHSGGFSGGSYEYDPNNRIHWGGEVAGNMTLQGVDVVSGQDICFDATNTLTIAGGGNTFVVQNGGNVNLIAGHNIRMLDGTSVHSGAYLHAYISNVYCTLPPAMLAAEEDTDAYIETVSEKSSELFKTQTNDLFRVYPNPTTGIFTLELITGNDSGSVKIEIFNLLGERILNTEQQTNSHYQLDLSGNKAGVYFIRVMYGENNKIEKLIKQ